MTSAALMLPTTTANPLSDLHILRASAANIYDLTADVTLWAATYLPLINTAIEKGDPSSLQELRTNLTNLTTAITERRSILLGTIDRQAALNLLQLLSFAASSLERHTQGGGSDPGAGIQGIPALEELMLILGYIAGHEPRDSHYTYWLTNTGPNCLTFTGCHGEKFFNEVVNLTQMSLTRACDIVKPLRTGDEGDPVNGTDRITAAKAEVVHLHERYRAYMLRDPSTGERNMTPDFFMTRMRQYLLP